MGRYILTSLFPFVMQDPGWSRDTIGLAFTIHFWAYAIFALVIGRLLDRIGGRTIILAGGILMLFGLIGLSRVETVWQFFLIFGIVLAAAVSMTRFVPNTAIVRKWFVNKAGLTTGLVTVGTVVGIGVLPPVVSRLGVLAGWRTACLICGIVIGGLIILIALFLVRNTPESIFALHAFSRRYFWQARRGNLDRGDHSGAWHHRRCWPLSVGLAGRHHRFLRGELPHFRWMLWHRDRFHLDDTAGGSNC